MQPRLKPKDGFIFAAWLRTGRLIRIDAIGGEREVKFNPNHDPQTGRFTFRGGGGGDFAGGGAESHEKWPDEPSPPAPRKTSIPRHATTTAKVAQPARTDPKKTGENATSIRVSKNGYRFDVDGSDRTHRASGELKLDPATSRSKTSQRLAGGSDRRTGDDGGHFIAARFGGPSDSFNHFAQDANFNRGEYRALEDGWAKELRAGKHVSVDIVAHYSETSRRPDSLTVEWSVNGRPQSKQFNNEPKGKKHGR